jgi:hypothetical protein
MHQTEPHSYGCGWRLNWKRLRRFSCGEGLWPRFVAEGATLTYGAPGQGDRRPALPGPVPLAARSPVWSGRLVCPVEGCTSPAISGATTATTQ